MRKIETQREIEKKSQRNKIIIGIVLAGLMLFSSIGYAFFSGERENSKKQFIEQNGIKFYPDRDRWRFEYNGAIFSTRYLPNETSSVYASRKLEDYYNRPIYFVGSGQAQQEISANIARFASRAQMACLNGQECEDLNLPEKNCTDNLIVFVENSVENIIRKEDNCVFIIGNESLKSADAFIYKLLGIK